MHEFEVGDRIEFRTHDGAEFRGVLRDFTEDYILLDNEPFPRPGVLPKFGTLGFPLEMIALMWAI